MCITGMGGVDGGGGKLARFPGLRAVGAGCSVLAFHPTKKGCILGKALMYAKVPEKQTVPRASAWAVYCVLVE